MNVFRSIFRTDALLNLFSGAYAIIAPQSFMAQFVGGPLMAKAESAVPWFGALCFAVGYIQWRLLTKANREALIAFLQGFLIGDVLYIWAFSRFVMSTGVWNLSSFLSVGTTASYFVVRVYYLFLHPERILSRDEELAAAKRP
jgi:hypothetical protein